MKKTILLFVAIFIASVSYAQGFNYKALITNNGTPVTNSTVSLKFAIEFYSPMPNPHHSMLWEEEHTGVTTDDAGICSVTIGNGTKISGSAATFNDISWTSLLMGHYELTVSVKLSGGSYHTLVNRETFNSVPFAKYANLAGKANDVGQLSNLGVGDMPNSNELVRFSVTSPSYGNDVLDLEFGAAPSYGTAQFIECNLSGTGVMFRVDHNGDIYNRGKLQGVHSGSADLKAYIYGAVTSSGSTVTDASSIGFTATKVSTGHYRVTFTHSVNINNYIVLVTNSASNYNSSVNRHNGYFDVYIRNITSNSYADGTFQFVVFKK